MTEKRRKAAVAVDKWFDHKQYPTAAMWAMSATDYEARIAIIDAVLDVVEYTAERVIKSEGA